jgi:16S rRNA (guanine(966)-N(2))-methyltransferase RsmD
LRVISGRYKGRRLTAVKGQKVRPTSDKLKAAIFNVLYSLDVTDDMENVSVLDIFAGTGALGIEAISRGAKSCCFIDKDSDAVDVIKKNLASLNADKGHDIIFTDYKNGLQILGKKGIQFDLIFMDPPYKKNLTFQAINNINIYEVFSRKCVIVAEHSSEEILPDTINEFHKITEKFYGDKVLSFYSLKNTLESDYPLPEDVDFA